MALPPGAPPAAAGQPNQIPRERRANGRPGPDPFGSLSAGAEVGEYIGMPTPDDQIEAREVEGGGAWVSMPGEGEREELTPPDAEFYSNLADQLPEPLLQKFATDLLRHIEDDKQARQKRDEQYEEGLRRTGLGKDAPGGAEFEGASRVVHPMLTEASIDYESRIIKELYPPSGPVKPKVLGVPTGEKVAKADRVAAHMNYQITTQIKEGRATLEQTLTQVPLGGSQFIRQFWDHRLKRPRWQFAAIDNVYLPFNAADFASSHRRTFAETVSQVEFRQRVSQGMYRDLDLAAPSQMAEVSKAQAAAQRIEGVSDTGENLDGDRLIYESTVYLEITEEMADALGVEEAGELYPYLLTVDESTHRVLSMYRDWEDGDTAREPIEHLFEFPFIPWRGAYAIGFPQIIGGLSAAATGALRALLDSAHVNNATGGLILKGAGVSGQTRHGEIGQFTEIDGGLETDDIRKRVMPFAFNQPAPVLFQLLEFVVQSARGIVQTALEETPQNAGAPVPVGTQMSRVEEALVVFSAVHGRAHAAFNRLIAGLYRLNRLYLPEQLKVDADGQEILVRRADYQGPCDVVSVSDPTIYSDQQRFAQLAYIQSRMMAAPQLWKARAVELAGLKLIKWPDPETLLADVPEPHELNAVAENVEMGLGRPVAVFPTQNHLAHLQVLLDFMRSPMLGSNPLIAPVYLPKAIRHASEHVLQFYGQQAMGLVQRASGQRPEELWSDDDAVKWEFDSLLAQVSQSVVPGVQQALAGGAPVMQQAMALLKQLTPSQQPVDPGTAALQAAQMETQRRSQADQATNQLGQAQLQSKNQLQQQQIAVQAQRNQVMQDNAQLASQTKLATTQLDNQAAADIEDQRAVSGEGQRFTTGESMGE